MKALVVERKNLKHNLKIIKEIINKDEKKTRIIAVIKGNGYGLGLVEYAQFLIDNGIDFLAVATTEEAIILRENILMMSSTTVERDIELLIQNKIILTVGSKEAGDVIEKIAKKLDKKIKVHLKIDTGFGRYGFIYNKKEEMVDIIKSWKNIQIDGVFSHFSIAFYGNGKESKEQFNRYMQCVDTLKNNNINTGMLHICNSSAFLRFNDMHLDAVRIGSALLGRLSIPNTWGFKKVGYLKSNVTEIKVLPAGYNIGYSNSYTTTKETKIAIIPCGYADGINVKVDRDMFRTVDKLRYIVRDIKDALKSKKLYVNINGEQCEILGRIGMFHVCANITGKVIKINDEAKFEINPMFVDSNITRDYD